MSRRSLIVAVSVLPIAAVSVVRLSAEVGAQGAGLVVAIGLAIGLGITAWYWHGFSVKMQASAIEMRKRASTTVEAARVSEEDFDHLIAAWRENPTAGGWRDVDEAEIAKSRGVAQRGVLVAPLADRLEIWFVTTTSEPIRLAAWPWEAIETVATGPVPPALHAREGLVVRRHNGPPIRLALVRWGLLRSAPIDPRPASVAIESLRAAHLGVGLT